jgi:hypothetical protein
MSSFSDYLENRVLDHIFRATASTAPAAVYLALFTVTPDDTGGGTEVSGAGYARQAITFGAASGGAIANTGAVSFTATGGNFGAVVAVGIFDASTLGNMLAWDGITSATVNDGDTITFAVGDLDVTLT